MRMLRLGFTLFLLIASQAAWAELDGHYWQLTLVYGKGGLELLNADPIPPMRKKIQTPGLDGAVMVLHYEVQWLDRLGGTLMVTTASLPLGSRVEDFSRHESTVFIPEESVAVVRLQGPDQSSVPTSIRLIQMPTPASAKLPAALKSGATILRLPPRAPKTQAAPLGAPGPARVTKFRDTGPDINRPVIAFIGDGYTEANMNANLLRTHAEHVITEGLAKTEPWPVFLSAVNFYALDVISNQEGADRIAAGVYVDTYFNCKDVFPYQNSWTPMIQAVNTMLGAGVWDKIVVMVNSDIGACAQSAGGAICLSGINNNYANALVHEMGHTFAGLADEYDYGSYASSVDAGEPNITQTLDRSILKWKNWIAADTPLPTPPTETYKDVVGAFEGAKYSSTGIYRPYLHCMMRDWHPFCPVCKEGHITKFFSTVYMTDAVSPALSNIQTVSNSGTKFSVTPIPIKGLQYRWTLGGETIADATSSTLTLSGMQITKTEDMLEVTISYPTPLVRNRTLQQTQRWIVKPERYNAVRHWDYY